MFTFPQEEFRLYFNKNSSLREGSWEDLKTVYELSLD